MRSAQRKTRSEQGHRRLQLQHYFELDLDFWADSVRAVSRAFLWPPTSTRHMHAQCTATVVITAAAPADSPEESPGKRLLESEPSMSPGLSLPLGPELEEEPAMEEEDIKPTLPEQVHLPL